MIKKLNYLLLIVLSLVFFVSCDQIEKTYSFKDVTNYEMSEITKTNVIDLKNTKFENNYNDILDIKYIESSLSYNKAINITSNYEYKLLIEFNNNNLIFYVYNNKLYYFSDKVLYESLSNINTDDFKSTDEEEVKLISVIVLFNYTNNGSNEAKLLLDGNLLWFNPSDYGIDKLVAGDILKIKYTGKYEVIESFPGVVNKDEMHIKSIEIEKAEVFQFIVTKKDNSDELTITPIDPNLSAFRLIDANEEGYVISKDNTFKKFNQYEEGTIIYGTNPISFSSLSIIGLYDYNPREENPTGQYDVTINTNDITYINELSNKSGKYTPGMELEFYFYPLMDVDLGMYINGKFYKTQEVIELDGKYVWKYSFIMPSEIVSIEFKVIS